MARFCGVHKSMTVVYVIMMYIQLVVVLQNAIPLNRRGTPFAAIGSIAEDPVLCAAKCREKRWLVSVMSRRQRLLSML